MVLLTIVTVPLPLHNPPPEAPPCELPRAVLPETVLFVRIRVLLLPFNTPALSTPAQLRAVLPETELSLSATVPRLNTAPPLLAASPLVSVI